MVRTQAGEVKLESNGKYSVAFETWAGKVGAEYLANTCTSAAVFETEDEAYAGQRRALIILEATDMFPNLCVPF